MNQPSAPPGQCLICAYDLDRRGGGTALSWQQVMTPAAPGKLRWVHVDFTHQQGRDWLRDDSGIDPAITDIMLLEDIRPRCLQDPRGILAVLRGVNLNPGSDVEDMVSVRVWLEKDRIVSARRRPVMSLQQIQEEVRAGNGPVSSGDFLARLIDKLGDRIGEVVENIDETIELAEAQQESNRLMTYRGEFGMLRRKTAHVRRYLSPQREALDRLSRMQSEILSPVDLASLQEETIRLTLFIEELDLSRERAMVAQEEMLSNLAQEQNTKMYLLSIVAAVFLPLSFLTGLMGMNVAGLPGTQDPWAFTILVAIMTAIGGGILLLFRWKKWL
jgi:zinc transporter